ncbi:sensor histidine kinase [Paraburkholderia sp. A3RO-2L]|uniref:sensor histidine kinase n=1 Tax=unclassified Paraburkholderia TaxID=2615204 RepID=UPI003DA98846
MENMGFRARVIRLFARKSRPSTEVATFPVQAFWRAISGLRQSAVLVRDVTFEVSAMTDEARDLFDGRSEKDLGQLLNKGLDTHSASLIRMAMLNPVTLVSDHPVRLQTPDVHMSVCVTVMPLPEFESPGAALLFFNDSHAPVVPGWERVMHEVFSRMNFPAWVVDPSGAIVFSNAAYPKFPLELVRSEEYVQLNGPGDQLELGRLAQLQLEISRSAAVVRATSQVSDSTYDFGKFGSWRIVHFPLEPQGGAGYVGVLAVPGSVDAMVTHSAEGDVSQADLSEVLQAREAERASLAREVHDSLGQELTGLKMDVRQLHNLVMNSGNPSMVVLGKLQSIRAHVDTLVATARNIAYAMKSDPVGVKGLAHAAHELVLGIRARIGLQIQLEILPGWVEPDKKMAHHMHRSLQEILNNVSKHAKATHCLVRLGFNGGMYHLEVRDDGVGLPVELTRGINIRSMGLKNLKERADLCGGQFSFLTRPEVEGTVMRMELPVRPVAAGAT